MSSLKRRTPPSSPTLRLHSYSLHPDQLPSLRIHTHNKELRPRTPKTNAEERNIFTSSLLHRVNNRFIGALGIKIFPAYNLRLLAYQFTKSTYPTDQRLSFTRNI